MLQRRVHWRNVGAAAVSARQTPGRRWPDCGGQWSGSVAVRFYVPRRLRTTAILPDCQSQLTKFPHALPPQRPMKLLFHYRRMVVSGQLSLRYWQ